MKGTVTLYGHVISGFKITVTLPRAFCARFGLAAHCVVAGDALAANWGGSLQNELAKNTLYRDTLEAAEMEYSRQIATVREVVALCKTLPIDRTCEIDLPE